MAPRKKALDLANLDNILNQLDEIYKKLQQIESTVETINKKKPISIRFDAGFTKSLQKIIDVIKQINGLEPIDRTVNVLNNMVQVFLALARSFKIVSAAVRLIPGGKELDSLSRAMLRIGQALATANNAMGSTTAGSFANLAKLIVVLPALFASLTVAFKGISFLAKIIPGGKEFALLTTSFSKLGNAFNALNKGLGGRSGGNGIAATVASVVRIGVVFPLLITGLTILFKGIGLISSIIPGDKAFGAMAKAMRKLSQTFVDVNESLGAGQGFKATVASIVRIGAIFPLLVTGLTVVFKGLALITSIIPGQRSFEKFTEALRNLGKAFADINVSLGAGSGITGTIAAVIRIGVIFPILFTQLSVIFRAISAILSIIPGGDSLLRLSQAFKNIGEALANIGKFSEVIGLGKLIKLYISIKFIGTILKELTLSFVRADAVEPFIKVAQGLAHVGEALVNMERASKNLSLVGILKLLVVIKVVGGAIRSLGKGITKEQANVVATIANAMESVGKAIRKIASSLTDLKTLDFEAFKQFSKMLKALKGLAKDFSKIAGKDANVEGLQAISGIVIAVGQAIKAVTGLLKQGAATGTKSDKTFDVIRLQFRELRDLVKDLKKIKPEKLDGVSKALVGLSSLLTTLSKTKVDPSRIEQLKILARGISEAVKELNFGFRSGGKISGLDKIAKSFDILGKVKANGNLVKDLARLITVLKDFSSSKVDVKGFNKVIQDLGKGLISLSKVKLSPSEMERVREYTDLLTKQAKAVKDLAEAQQLSGKTDLSGLNTGAMAGDAKKALSGVDTVAKGTEIGVAKVLGKVLLLRTAWKAVIYVVREFNPAALFQKAVGAVAAFGNAIRGVINFFDQIDQKIRSVITSISTMGSNITNFGSNLNNTFGVGAILNSSGFQTAVEFDTLSTQLQTFGRLTDEQLLKAEAFADVIGIKYPLSANDAISAMLDLTKAGQDLPAIESILPSAADLASLTDTKDIKLATALLINAQSAFSEFSEGVPSTFDNISKAADIVANTADLTFASVEQLQEGIANVGPIANQYGLNFADVNAILGTFSNNSLLGAEGGTALKSALTNLNTDTAKNELAKLGVSLVDGQGNFRDLNDIILDLNKTFTESSTITVNALPGVSSQNRAQIEEATKVLEKAQRQVFLYQNQLVAGSGDEENRNNKIAEYNRQIQAAQGLITNLTGSQETANYITQEVTRSQQQNAESIKNIFGSYGQVAGAILLSADGFGELRDQITGSGTAAERAAALLDNYAGDVLQLQGSVETLNKKAFRPLIEKIFRPFVKLGRLIVDSLLQMNDGVLEFISTAIAFASIFATVVGTGAIVVGTLIQVGAAFFTLALALTNIITLVAAVVAGGAALVTGLVVITGAALGLSLIIGTITAAFEGLRAIFSEDLGGARTSFENFVAKIGEGAAAIIGLFQSLGNLITTLIAGSGAGGLEDVGASIATFFDNLTNNATLKRVTDFTTGLSEIFNVLGSALTLDDRVDAAAKATQDSLDFASNYAKISGSQIFNQVTNSKKAVLDAYKELLDGLLDNPVLADILNKFSLSKEDVANFVANFLFFAQQFRASVGTLFKSFTTFFDNVGKVGFTKAFDQLGVDLKAGFKGLFLVVLNGLQDVFNVDVSDIIAATEQGGLADGLALAFSNILNGVKAKIIQNRAGITSILKSVLGLFFAPLKSIGFIAKLFGIAPLEAIVNEITRIVEGLFGGVLDVVFNLLEGQSISDALKNAFGPGIEPLLDFVDAVGNAAEKIFEFFGMIFESIFGPVQVGGEGSVQIIDVVNNILTTLTDLIKTFTDEVLTPLSQGNFAGAIGGIATLLGSEFLGKIAEELATGDFIGAIGVIGAEFGRIITEALKLVPTLITSIGTDLNSPLLTAIGTDMAEGDWLGVIGTIANGIKDVFITAITAVPGLITNLGEILNSPFLTKIGDSLKTGDFSTVVTTIATGIKDLIVKALGEVPTLLTTLGTALNLDFLTDIGITLEQSEAFQNVITAIGNMAALPIETINSIATNIGTIIAAIEKLGQTNPTLLTAIGIAVGFIFIKLAGGFLALKGLLLAAAPALATVLVPIGGLIALMLVLKNGIQAIADVVSGKKNIFEGIASFFTGLASDALGLLGVEISPEEIANRITTFFNSVNGLVTLFLTNAINQAKTAFGNIIDGLIGSLDDAQARFDQSVLGAKSGSGDLFFGIQQSISDKNFRAISDQLVEAAEKGFDLEPFRRLLRNNFTGVMAAFQTDLPNLFSFAPEDFGAVINTLVNANALDDAIALVPPDRIKEFYQKLFALPPSELVGLDFTTIQAQLQQGLTNGLFDLSSVTDFVLKLPNLTDAQKQAIIDSFSAQLGTGTSTPVDVPIDPQPSLTPTAAENYKLGLGLLLSGATPTTTDAGVPVDVPVNPQPSLTPTAPADFKTGLDLLLAGTFGGTGTEETPLEPIIPVIPEFTLPTTPEDALALADNLFLATTNLGLLEVSLGTFTINSQPAIDQLNAMATSMNDVHNNIAAVIGRLTALLGILGVLTVTAQTQLPLSANAFGVWATRVSNSLNPVLNKLNQINTAIAKAVAGLASVAAGTGGGNEGQPGGLAYGGPTQLGKIYEVIERKMPEIYEENGRTYLLPAASGQVTPLAPLPSFGTSDARLGLGSNLPINPGSRFNPSTNSQNSVNITEGDVNITVDGSRFTDPVALARTIGAEVDRVISARNVNVKSRLRTGHR